MPPASSDDLDARGRLLVLGICCLSLLLVGMDGTIVNVALPAIGTDLHASVAGLQWTIDAYTLVIASLLLLAGSTADRLGRKKVFMTGVITFTTGSLLCSLAPGLGWLVAARMVQAVGGSMMNPVAMSIITNVFTDPKERARAIGVWGATVGLSLGLGPVIGGFLVGSVGWPSIFLINVPIGIAAVVLVWRFVPESKAARARRPDPWAQVLVIELLGIVTYAIIEAPSKGWTSPVTLLLLAAGAGALALLVVHENSRTEPLIELRFFKSLPFAGATVSAVAAFGGFGGFLFLNTLYLQDVRGLSALAAGALTLPMAGMTLLLAPVSGRIVGTRGPKGPLVGAGILIALGSLMLTSLTATTSLWLLAASYLVFGAGFGLVNAPITNTAVSGMPRAQAGVAAGLASTSRQVGQSLGVAVIGSAAVASANGGLHAGLAASSHVGWWVCAGCGVTITVLGFATSSRRAKRSAEVVAETLEAPELLAVAA